MKTRHQMVPPKPIRVVTGRFLGMMLLVTLLVLFQGSSDASITSPPAVSNGLVESPWPMWLHDPQHTGRSPYIGPQTNKVKCVFDLESTWASGVSSIGSDGTIYLARPEGLYAIDPGCELLWLLHDPYPPWDRKTLAIGPNGIIYVADIDGVSAINPDSSLKWNVPVTRYYATVNPVLDRQGRLYYAAGCLLPGGQVHPCLIALALDGGVLWVYDLENGTTYEQPDFPLGEGRAGGSSLSLTTSPTIDPNGTIYIGYEQTLFAINPDGTEKWRETFDVARIQHPNIVTPSVGSDGTIYVPVEGAREDPWVRGDTGSLYAIDPNGAKKWERGIGYVLRTPLIGPDGTLYVSYLTYPVDHPVGHLVAFDTQGNGKWSKHWANEQQIPQVVDAEGAIYTAPRFGRTVRAWDANGNEKWSWVSLGENVTSLSLGQDGTLYVATWSALHALGLRVVTIEIDIKPGSDPNSINCNSHNGVIPVAILTTGDFDATAVDHTSVTFEGASETHVGGKTGEPRRHEEDVDSDGDTDLVFHFRLDDTDLTCDSTEGTLTGETFDGQAIEGTDAVRMIDRGGGRP